jgi:hypothetical protein
MSAEGIAPSMTGLKFRWLFSNIDSRDIGWVGIICFLLRSGIPRTFNEEDPA